MQVGTSGMKFSCSVNIDIPMHHELEYAAFDHALMSCVRINKDFSLMIMFASLVKSNLRPMKKYGLLHDFLMIFFHYAE